MNETKSQSGSILHAQAVVTPPRLTITTDHNNLKVGDTALLTFTFNKAVVGFTANDIPSMS